MIKANFSAYSTYITDSLHQWDINQTLEVTGLNLTTAPEVHFSNSNSGRAIVRQATLSRQVVSVKIPNSLLQEPLRIFAHIGIYEGDTFKVVELVEIPVQPRKRPEDYQMTDTDEEVYSFKRLENQLANKATTAQVANIIAHNNDTEGNTELMDLRYGADGKTYASAGEAVRGLYAPSMPETIYAGNYKTLLPDVNIQQVSIYKLLFAEGSTDIPANLPFTEWEGGLATLFTTNTQTPNSTHYVTQMLVTEKNIFYRYAGTTFKIWHAMIDKRGPLLSNPTTIDASNYKTLLPDVNDITDATVYKLLFAKGSTDIPANLPFTEWEGVIASLVTFNSGSIGSAYYGVQLLLTTENVYYRYGGASEYMAWTSLSEKMVKRAKDNTLTVSSGGSILTALKKCYAEGYTRLVVEAGDYDIIEEYENHYGTSYFTNYTGYTGQTDKFSRGLWLEDIEVVFSPGAKVVCKYTGDNDAVKYNFCAFATGNNVTIDGLHLDAENLRYGIHADFNTGTEVTTFKVCNCDLRHHRSDTNAQAIGAGLGVHVLWEIENTIFRSDTKAVVFRIHNNVSAVAQSKVVIRNCYIEGPGFFRFNSYADSEALTDIWVSGCSYINEPVVGMEIEGATTPENIKLTAWNNEIRK